MCRRNSLDMNIRILATTGHLKASKPINISHMDVESIIPESSLAVGLLYTPHRLY